MHLLLRCPPPSLTQVCFKQNVHKHSLAFIQAQAKLFEPVPANFTSADASSLFQDKQTGRQAGTHDMWAVQQGTPAAGHTSCRHGPDPVTL